LPLWLSAISVSSGTRLITKPEWCKQSVGPGRSRVAVTSEPHGICYAHSNGPYLNCFSAPWAPLSSQDGNNQIGRVRAQLYACHSQHGRGALGASRGLKAVVGGPGSNSAGLRLPPGRRLLIIAEPGPAHTPVPVTHKRNIIRMRLRVEFSLGT
jgi:hypothetical protein